MPHLNSLNNLAKLSLNDARAVVDKLQRHIASLASKAGSMTVSPRWLYGAAEAMKYTWTVESEGALKKNIEAAVNAASISEFGPLDDILRTSALSWGNREYIEGIFDYKMTPGIWSVIEDERAKLGYNVSSRLWYYANDATTKALAIIRDGLDGNKPYRTVAGELEALLTEKGRANALYNIKRLYVTETRFAYAIAQREMRKRFPFITQVKVQRSDQGDADWTCEDCNSQVGTEDVPFTVYSVENVPLLPLHPWCKCIATDVVPSPAALKAWLDKNVPLKAKATKPPEREPPAKVVAPQQAPPAPATTLGQLTPDERLRRKLNQEASQKNLDRVSKRLKKELGWTDAQVQEMNDLVWKNIGGLTEKHMLPEVKYVKLSPDRIAQWTDIPPRISVNSGYGYVKSPREFATEIVHEYGHAIQNHLREGNLSVVATAPSNALSFFASQADVNEIVVEATNFLQTIRQYTANIFENGRGNHYTPNPLMPLGKLQDILTDFQTIVLNSNNAIFPGKMGQVICDLGGGWLTKVAHSKSYLADAWKTVSFRDKAGNMTQLFGLSEQEAFNMLWQFVTNAQPDTMKTFGTYVASAMPGLLEAAKRWAAFAARKP